MNSRPRNDDVGCAAQGRGGKSFPVRSLRVAYDPAAQRARSCASGLAAYLGQRARSVVTQRLAGPIRVKPCTTSIAVKSHSTTAMVIKAVIFDIGGVVLGSPISGVNDAERKYGLPQHYLNASITARGKRGAFQRLERGEIDLGTFYKEFGREMSDVETGNMAYKVYCERRGIECPALPTRLDIDGKEVRSRGQSPVHASW